MTMTISSTRGPILAAYQVDLFWNWKKKNKKIHGYILNNTPWKVIQFNQKRFLSRGGSGVQSNIFYVFIWSKFFDFPRVSRTFIALHTSDGTAINIATCFMMQIWEKFVLTKLGQSPFYELPAKYKKAGICKRPGSISMWTTSQALLEGTYYRRIKSMLSLSLCCTHSGEIL